jgi:hypothetical protein
MVLLAELARVTNYATIIDTLNLSRLEKCRVMAKEQGVPEIKCPAPPPPKCRAAGYILLELPPSKGITEDKASQEPFSSRYVMK